MSPKTRRRRNLAALAALLLVALASGCARASRASHSAGAGAAFEDDDADDVTDADTHLARHVIRLAGSLMDALLEDKGGESWLVSPLNLHQALTILLLGSASESHVSRKLSAALGHHSRLASADFDTTARLQHHSWRRRLASMHTRLAARLAKQPSIGHFRNLLLLKHGQHTCPISDEFRERCSNGSKLNSVLECWHDFGRIAHSDALSVGAIEEQTNEWMEGAELSGHQIRRLVGRPGHALVLAASRFELAWARNTRRGGGGGGRALLVRDVHLLDFGTRRRSHSEEHSKPLLHHLRKHVSSLSRAFDIPLAGDELSLVVLEPKRAAAAALRELARELRAEPHADGRTNLELLFETLNSGESHLGAGPVAVELPEFPEAPARIDIGDYLDELRLGELRAHSLCAINKDPTQCVALASLVHVTSGLKGLNTGHAAELATTTTTPSDAADADADADTDTPPLYEIATNESQDAGRVLYFVRFKQIPLQMGHLNVRCGSPVRRRRRRLS